MSICFILVLLASLSTRMQALREQGLHSIPGKSDLKNRQGDLSEVDRFYHVFFQDTQTLPTFFFALSKIAKLKSHFSFPNVLGYLLFCLKPKHHIFFFCLKQKPHIWLLSTPSLVSYLKKHPVQQKHIAQLNNNKCVYGDFWGGLQRIPLFFLKIWFHSKTKINPVGFLEPRENVKFNFPRRI